VLILKADVAQTADQLAAATVRISQLEAELASKGQAVADRDLKIQEMQAESTVLNATAPSQDEHTLQSGVDEGWDFDMEAHVDIADSSNKSTADAKVEDDSKLRIAELEAQLAKLAHDQEESAQSQTEAMQKVAQLESRLTSRSEVETELRRTLAEQEENLLAMQAENGELEQELVKLRGTPRGTESPFGAFSPAKQDENTSASGWDLGVEEQVRDIALSAAQPVVQDQPDSASRVAQLEAELAQKSQEHELALASAQAAAADMQQASEARIGALEEEITKLQESVPASVNVQQQIPLGVQTAVDGWDDFDDFKELKA